MGIDTKTFWNENADAHLDIAYQYDTNPDERYPFYEVRRDRLLEDLEKRPKGRLLDAGCGAAQILIEILQRGWDGYGIDFAERMIEHAKRLMAEEGLDPNRVQVGSLQDLSPYDDNRFDVVVCMGVLEYLAPEEEEIAFSEIGRVLKPGGLFYAECINMLFDLMTFNRFTVNFFRDHVTSLFFDSPEQLDQIDSLIKGLVTYPEKPDLEGRYSTTRDQVYCKVENPLTYHEKAKALGFEQKDMFFYRFHAVPPLLFEQNPEFEKVPIDLEKALSRHWIGNFMATGFISVLENGKR